MSDYMIMNFDDGFVPDEDWARTLPQGTRAYVVAPKGDSGNDTFSIAVGEGRNGTNALRVHCDRVLRTDKNINNGEPFLSDNLPGFWIKIVNVGKGGTLDSPRNSSGYFVPRGMRANRLHCWLKFPSGYRINNAAGLVSGNSPYFNFVVGSYHYDPGKIDGSDYVKESDNFHFYWQLSLRHDIADDGWIHCVVNEMPTHQRGLSQTGPPVDITQPMGSVMELLTRFYFDSNKYYTTPEISYPYSILVDSIYTSYVEDDPDIRVQIENFGDGQDFVYTLGETHNLAVNISNDSASDIAGRIYLRARSTVKPKLLDGASNINNTVVTIPANSSKTYTFQISTNPPDSSTPNPYTLRCGVAFARVSDSTDPIGVSGTAGGSQPNVNDPNVMVSRNVYSTYSPIDGRVSGAYIRAIGYHSPPTQPPKPWSLGGRYYAGPLNSVITGTLPGGSSSGRPLAFSLVSQQSSGGSILIAQDGAFSFTPSPGFEGAFFFRYKLNDGFQDSMTYGSWVIAADGEDPTPPPVEPPDEPSSTQKKLFLANNNLLLSSGRVLGY